MLCWTDEEFVFGDELVGGDEPTSWLKSFFVGLLMIIVSIIAYVFIKNGYMTYY